MRRLDTPVVLGRTPRELVLIGGGLLLTVWEIWDRGTFSGNTTVYLLFTLALAVRFFAARALLVGLIVGAMAQVVPSLRLVPWSETGHWLLEHLGLCGLWAGGLVVLCSRDLVQRYDRHPSRHGWIPNFWVNLSPWDQRLLRACGYALGGLVATLVMFWCRGWIRPAWVMVAIVVGSAAALLLVLGRAVVLLAIPLFCGLVIAALLPHLGAAEARIAALRESQLPPLFCADTFAAAPEYVLPAILFAVVAALIALPYATRVLARGLRAPGS